MCSKSLDTLLAPKTLCTAANRAAPWSEAKWGAKMHPLTHFLLKNLHAPHGAAGAGADMGSASGEGAVVARFPTPLRRGSDMGSGCCSAIFWGGLGSEFVQNGKVVELLLICEKL